MHHFYYALTIHLVRVLVNTPRSDNKKEVSTGEGPDSPLHGRSGRSVRIEHTVFKRFTLRAAPWGIVLWQVCIPASSAPIRQDHVENLEENEESRY